MNSSLFSIVNLVCKAESARAHQCPAAIAPSSPFTDAVQRNPSFLDRPTSDLVLSRKECGSFIRVNSRP